MLRSRRSRPSAGGSETTNEKRKRGPVTRPAFLSPASKLRVNFVADETLLQTRVRLGTAKIESLHLVFSSDPIIQSDMDVYIVPESVFLSSDTMNRLLYRSVVIGYGDTGLLDAAFCSGCDDYLKEPWSPTEMYTRLSRFTDSFNLSFENNRLSIQGTRIHCAGGHATLTAHEALILKTLLKNSGSIIPREVFRLVLHGKRDAEQSRSIDMHISSIRKKIRYLLPESTGPLPIQTVRGIGYMVTSYTTGGEVVQKPVDNKSTTL